jgi:transcriptional regulator with XRE-family HTH domain
MTQFGDHVRAVREALRTEDRLFSLRQVAQRVGVEPAYLSKIERGDVPPPSEETTVKLARELNEDPDVLLAMAAKGAVSPTATCLRWGAAVPNPSLASAHDCAPLSQCGGASLPVDFPADERRSC